MTAGVVTKEEKGVADKEEKNMAADRTVKEDKDMWWTMRKGYGVCQCGQQGGKGHGGCRHGG